MNSLPWIKYFPREMFCDTAGMSAHGERAHRRLFDLLVIQDGRLSADDESLRNQSSTPPAEWGRTKRELLGRGWRQTGEWFHHPGTIKTVNEAKVEAIARHNQTVSATNKQRANKGKALLPYLVATPPHPDIGVIDVMESVTPPVTDAVAEGQEDKHLQTQVIAPPQSLSLEKGCGEKPAPSASGAEGVDSAVAEECEEIPDEEQAVALTKMGTTVAEDFARYVHRTWWMQGGKNGNGMRVPWLRYVVGRWKNEQVEWQNGTHTGNRASKAGSKPAEGRQPFLGELNTQLRVKKELRDKIRHRGHDMAGDTWRARDAKDAADYKRLNTEIAALMHQIDSYGKPAGS